MRCVDANVLVYAHRAETPDHRRYREWLDDARRRDEPLGVVTWYSADRGFTRFTGLRWRNPLDH